VVVEKSVVVITCGIGITKVEAAGKTLNENNKLKSGTAWNAI
jgi:hypothetical protein